MAAALTAAGTAGHRAKPRGCQQAPRLPSRLCPGASPASVWDQGQKGRMARVPKAWAQQPWAYSSGSRIERREAVAAPRDGEATGVSRGLEPSKTRGWGAAAVGSRAGMAGQTPEPRHFPACGSERTCRRGGRLQLPGGLQLREWDRDPGFSLSGSASACAFEVTHPCGLGTAKAGFRARWAGGSVRLTGTRDGRTKGQFRLQHGHL